MKRLIAALLPALVFLLGDQTVLAFSGRPASLGDAYQVVLPLAALCRYAGMFALAGVAWCLIRRSQGGRWLQALALVSGPVSYAISASWQMSSYFPAGEAAYYALNPLVIAALGSSAAWAAVAEMVWRRALSWRLVLIACLGWAILWATVLWDGGVHWFYVYQLGYRALFA